MSVSDIHLHDAERASDSLTASLQAVARSYGLAVEYDTLHAVLGLSFMVCAPSRGEFSPEWESPARDWNLVRAARLLGIELRALHPAPAAAELRGAGEYRQHFVDSYAPLVRQALEHDQPVVAWHGWPGDLAPQWGVITDTTRDGVGLRGKTPGCLDRPVTMIEPPVQCYIAETGTGAHMPDARELVRFAMCAADIVVHNRIDPSFGVITGHGAYDTWLQWLDEQPADPVALSGSAARLARRLVDVANARRSGLNFLDRHRGDLAHALHPAVDELAAALRGAIATLGAPDGTSAGEQTSPVRSGPGAWAGNVRALQEAERKVAEHVGRLAGLVPA